MNYIGENLLPGQIGHFCIVLSFVAALLAAVTYYFATQNRADETAYQSWRKLGRIAFLTHTLSVLTVIGTIFYVMTYKKFEYFYAHSHTDTELPFRYIFAAFWEGQEGSFLLWMFWHVVLGCILLFRGREWETSTLSVLSSIQIFLGSMLLGLYLGFGEHLIKWGSNPLLLLRDTQPDAPIFKTADYLSKMAASAKGLNPLLQNYWMTIHPPTLFLGFASTSIPFCFAIAGLWTRRYTEWLRPSMSWVLFSAAILGTGILMGGAWAYEALSFGGYWAWDPVENMSLVPWLVLIAGLHTHLVANATGYSIKATFLFYILTFLLVVYSTFLTRSGILGDTSVHAFTEIGLEWQLVIFQAFFLAMGLGALWKHNKNIPAPAKEEEASSKEFWMFIGSLVLMMSVVLITFTTSIPVYNKIFTFFGNLFHFKAPSFTSPVEPVAHYNKYQLWIGVFIGMLSGGAQFLRFKGLNFDSYQKTLYKHLIINLLISGALTALAVTWIEASAWQYILLLFSGIFTVVTNLDYVIFFLRGNLKQAASVFSHVGFGLMIVGILASGLNKHWVSKNRFIMDGMTNFNQDQMNKNIMLLKGKPMPMNDDYEVTYTGDTTFGHTREFNVFFRKKDKKFEKVLDSFTLKPYILWNKGFEKIASTNPQTQHYWNKDVFTHIAALPPSEQDPKLRDQEEAALKYENVQLAQNQSFTYQGWNIMFEKLNFYRPNDGGLGIGLKLKVSKGDSIFSVEPLTVQQDGHRNNLSASVNDLGFRFKLTDDFFEKLFPSEKALVFKTYSFKIGDSVMVGKHKVQFTGFGQNPEHPNYKKEEGDMAFSAKLMVGDALAQPLYVIRDNRPMTLNDGMPDLGLHFGIQKIDPTTQIVFIDIAQDVPQSQRILPFAIADKAPRTDYIVLEAIIFPGINYFWIGSIMMMFGLGMGMVRRLFLKH
jgi:cytochrome c-type biogenesis protein CcmF